MKVMRQLSKFAAGSAAVAVAAIASVGIAQADGMPSRGRAIVYEKPADWSGFYFGVHSGWAWSDFDATFLNGNTFGVSHDAPLVGGQIGIQHQFGNFVLGVEGNLSVAFQDDHASSACPNPAFTCAARFDDVLTIGPRLGWAMGKWMPYLTGGYASAAYDSKLVNNASNVNFLPGTASPARDRERHSGWYIGAGVDMLVANNWTVGLEYRHYELDDATYTPNVNGANGAIGFGPPFNADVTLDTVTLRVSWKLGRPEAAPLK